MSPSSDHRIPVEQFDRYAAGESTPLEQRQMQSTFDHNTEANALAYAMRPRPELADVLWARYQQSRPRQRFVETPAEPPIVHRTRPWYRTPVAYGAGLGVAGLLGIGIARSFDAFSSATVRIERSYTTQPGQRLRMQLPDGSHVVVAPASQVAYREDNRGHRHLTVAGQALFTVMHDPQRPFVVTSGPATTRVLGTTFHVRYYPGDSAAEVAVIEGKVESGGRRGPVLLSAGMAGVVTDSSARTIAGADVEALTGWADGQLVFKNVPVRAMLTTLGRWYGFEFRVTDTVLAKVPVSATLAVNAPEEMLQALRDMLEVQVSFDGSIVTLSPDDGRDKRERPGMQGVPEKRIHTRLEVGK